MASNPLMNHFCSYLLIPHNNTAESSWSTSNLLIFHQYHQHLIRYLQNGLELQHPSCARPCSRTRQCTHRPQARSSPYRTGLSTTGIKNPGPPTHFFRKVNSASEISNKLRKGIFINNKSGFTGGFYMALWSHFSLLHSTPTGRGA